jgi:YaaC-like Protein
VRKAIVAPNFTAETVLVSDNWDFVDLWLRKIHGVQSRAEFFWRQARAFYTAAKSLQKTASPLASYYSALNATKALMFSKAIPFSPQHGVTGSSAENRTTLMNERVTIRRNGVLPALCRYLGETANDETYDLKNILYNLPYIHRSFCTTFRSARELFIPADDLRFVRKRSSSEAWFCCDIREPRYQNEHIFDTLPGFERDAGVRDRFIVRKHTRFRWEHGGARASNIQRLTAYHKRVRQSVRYIYGISRLWYLKRDYGGACSNRSSLTLTFGALHRLSELSRYSPDVLDRHFNAQHNWLLSQFIDRALDQFIDEISAEITGYDFMLPGYVSR